jgi:hypothetical protein
MVEWSRLGIPKAIFERIDKTIKERPDLGYTSVVDFLVDAARRRLEQLEAQELTAQIAEVRQLAEKAKKILESKL